jgi:Tfp pilus assembly protein PilO
MTVVTVRNYKMLVWIMPVVLVVLARSPLMDQITAMYGHIEAIRLQLASIKKTGVTIGELPGMKNDFERLAHKKMEIASSLLGAGSEASLYDLLMLKAAQTGAAIVSVSPRTTQRSNEGFAELPLSIEAAGTFNNLARFIAAIENVNRLMRIEELAMSRDREGRLTASMQLVVYRAQDSAFSAHKNGKDGKRRDAAYLKGEQYREDLKRALAVAIPATSNTYTFAGQGDPFGAVVSGPVKKGPVASQTPGKPLGLTLKGILWKQPPLAILEALDGSTYIVKEGDPVNGFKISSITRTEVVIATPQGNHVLQQYDTK